LLGNPDHITFDKFARFQTPCVSSSAVKELLDSIQRSGQLDSTLLMRVRKAMERSWWKIPSKDEKYVKKLFEDSFLIRGEFAARLINIELIEYKDKLNPDITHQCLMPQFFWFIPDE